MALKKINFNEVKKDIELFDKDGNSLGVVDSLFSSHIGMHVRNGYYCLFESKFDAYVKYEPTPEPTFVPEKTAAILENLPAPIEQVEKIEESEQNTQNTQENE